MPQCGDVNKNLGSQCGRNDGLCYRTIEFQVGTWDGTTFTEDVNCRFDCPATDSQETLDLIDAMECRKAKWDYQYCLLLVANSGKPKDEITPAKFKNYICACRDNILVDDVMPIKIEAGPKPTDWDEDE